MNLMFIGVLSNLVLSLGWMMDGKLVMCCRRCNFYLFPCHILKRCFLYYISSIENLSILHEKSSFNIFLKRTESITQYVSLTGWEDCLDQEEPGPSQHWRWFPSCQEESSPQLGCNFPGDPHQLEGSQTRAKYFLPYPYSAPSWVDGRCPDGETKLGVQHSGSGEGHQESHRGWTLRSGSWGARRARAGPDGG